MCKMVAFKDQLHQYQLSSTYIQLGARQDETNVAADWLQIDSRAQIAAVCVREKKNSAV